MKFTFIKDMVNNPDGTYSSKRMGGWIALGNFIYDGIANKPEHILTTGLLAVCAFWGLTSLDYKSYLGNTPSPDKNTPSA